MFWVTRTAIAAVLALAVAALPLMLDRCAESCDAHQRTVASAPACHHAAPVGTRITPAPASCGHDHHGTVVTAAKDVAATRPALALVATISPQRSAAFPAAADAHVDQPDPPNPSPPLAGRSLPLRV